MATDSDVIHYFGDESSIFFSCQPYAHPRKRTAGSQTWMFVFLFQGKHVQFPGLFLENKQTVIPQCLKFNLVLGEWDVLPLHLKHCASDSDMGDPSFRK